jgi:hypothetical protein
MSDAELVKRLLDFDKVTVGDARDAALRIEELGRLARGQGEQLEIQGNELCRRASHGHKQADRIEALTEQLEAARADAKEAEAYAEELEKEHDKVWDEAVWAVAQVVDQEMARIGFSAGPDGFGRRAEMRNVIVEELKSVQSMRATLAEIEGTNAP